jgi:hypothetical protein
MSTPPPGSQGARHPPADGPVPRPRFGPTPLLFLAKAGRNRQRNQRFFWEWRNSAHRTPIFVVCAGSVCPAKPAGSVDGGTRSGLVTSADGGALTRRRDTLLRPNNSPTQCRHCRGWFSQTRIAAPAATRGTLGLGELPLDAVSHLFNTFSNSLSEGRWAALCCRQRGWTLGSSTNWKFVATSWSGLSACCDVTWLAERALIEAAGRASVRRVFNLSVNRPAGITVPVAR